MKKNFIYPLSFFVTFVLVFCLVPALIFVKSLHVDFSFPSLFTDSGFTGLQDFLFGGRNDSFSVIQFVVIYFAGFLPQTFISIFNPKEFTEALPFFYFFVAVPIIAFTGIFLSRRVISNLYIFSFWASIVGIFLLFFMYFIGSVVFAEAISNFRPSI